MMLHRLIIKYGRIMIQFIQDLSFLLCCTRYGFLYKDILASSVHTAKLYVACQDAKTSEMGFKVKPY